MGAKNNIGNAMSFTQTQDGYFQKISKAYNRMSELAILARDETKTDADRALYNKEFQTLYAFTDEASKRDFNGVSLFSGAPLAVTTDGEGNVFSMNGISLGSASYGGLTSTTAAASALTQIKIAIDSLTTDRATIGSYQSRLSYSSEQLTVSAENLTAATSRIQDTDVADESVKYARYNILSQAGTAMLAQANQLPQSVLRLLQG